jgi:hypothetical protein
MTSYEIDSTLRPWIECEEITTETVITEKPKINIKLKNYGRLPAKIYKMIIGMKLNEDLMKQKGLLLILLIKSGLYFLKRRNLSHANYPYFQNI